MAITVENNIFTIKTKHTMYQMKVDEYGVLLHLWYGKDTGMNMDYLLDYPDLGFSGNIYEAGNQRTYSLDTLPQEYPTYGVGDYRISAISVTHADGSNALDLRYVTHCITKGKYTIDGLPAVYARDSEADTLAITLKDTASDVQVILKYGVLYDLDVITRSAVVVNRGEEDITIHYAHSMALDFVYGDFDWIHFYGRHSMERQMERTSVMHGIQESSSTRGTSSHHQNPAFILCDRDCTETAGYCVGAMLMYSGGFAAQIEKDQLNQTRAVLGIQPHGFLWNLKKDESFATPEAILSCSTQGFEKLSHHFHQVIREHVCRGEYQWKERPVLINNWEATYFQFDEEKIYQIAKDAKKLGVDMMVLDDGWFGKRDGDVSGLGDWTVNTEKLKGGLPKLVERTNQLGMKFGIWFEPEMVSEDSTLYRQHPEWAIQIPKRKPQRSRYQLVLDLSREDVRNYLFDAMCSILDSANIEYVKWDMNRSLSDLYSAELKKECQGELLHRYVLGLYELLERLTSRYPHILWEGCSGGGGRFDAGMLYYCPQIWCSDNTDAYARTKIQYGTSFFYPVSTMGSHVSAVPNHQTGRVTSLATRGITAMAGTFGYELDLNTLSEEEKEEVKEQIQTFKKYGPLIHNGDYYRLTNPMKDEEAIWSYVAKDRSEVLVHGVVFPIEAAQLRHRVKLRGLDPDKEYYLAGTKQHYSGIALMEAGVLLPRVYGDYSPVSLYFTERKESVQ